MRDIKAIVLHCSATPPGRDIGAAEIRKWHKAKGWKDIGYHFVIRLSGKTELGRSITQAGSHVLGHNATTVGVCYIGGVDADMQPLDTMNAAQEAAFEKIVKTLRGQYGPLEIFGHNDFTDAKACPSFKVGEKFARLKLAAQAKAE